MGERRSQPPIVDETNSLEDIEVLDEHQAEHQPEHQDEGTEEICEETHFEHKQINLNGEQDISQNNHSDIQTSEQAEGELEDEANAMMVTVGDAQMPLTTMLESLLFVAETPTAPEQFARVLDLSTDDVEFGLLQLAELYKTKQRGLRIQERDGKYLLVTLPATANVIEHFLNLDLNMKLSGPALEALAIIAYRQPVTRQQVEAVRGVDCGHVLRVLLQHDLIAETGRLKTAGRSILYGITDRFMQHFGLTELTELPKLDLKEEDLLWAATELGEEVATEEQAEETTKEKE